MYGIQAAYQPYAAGQPKPNFGQMYNMPHGMPMQGMMPQQNQQQQMPLNIFGNMYSPYTQAGQPGQYGQRMMSSPMQGMPQQKMPQQMPVSAAYQNLYHMTPSQIFGTPQVDHARPGINQRTAKPIQWIN